MIYMRAATEPWIGGLEEQANRLPYVCRGSGTLAWPDSSCPAHARRIACTILAMQTVAISSPGYCGPTFSPTCGCR